MLKLTNIILHKVSSGLYKVTLKVYDLEKDIAKKRVKSLCDCNAIMAYKIMENKDVISNLKKNYNLE